jgi:hypothetical protein
MPPTTPRRATLLESPRAYAREKLQASGEFHRVQREHARAMREMLSASRHAREMGRVPYRASMDSDRMDIDNARDAFAWARASGDRALAVELGALRGPRSALPSSSACTPKARAAAATKSRRSPLARLRFASSRARNCV